MRNSPIRIIALDGGTTNTRLTLVADGVILDRKKLSCGIRDGKEALVLGLSREIPLFLSENGLAGNDITAITASGMVTSELGLYTVPHIVTPVGAKELSERSVMADLPEICDIPFRFVPGVKTFDSAENLLADMDIMRGEETETVAILDRMGLFDEKNVTLILPGSHMKVVVCNRGKIVHFVTTLSGELTRAAAENTILKNSVGDAFFRELSLEHLYLGYKTAEALGMGAALFKVRVEGNFAGADKKQLYSVLLGAVLYDDIDMIVKNSKGTVVVGGSDPFRSAYLELLSGRVKNILEVPEELAENAAAYGVWTVTEQLYSV